MSSSRKDIFISYAEEDRKIVSYFIEELLIGVFSFKHDRIRSFSEDGMKFDCGEDWRNQVKSDMEQAKVIFLIITPNYKASEACLNEMGAAWVIGKKVKPLIITPIDYSNVGVLHQFNHLEALNNETSLDRIKDQLHILFGNELSSVKTDRWTSKKREFLTKVNLYLKKNPFKPIVTNKTFLNLQEKYNSLMNDYTKIVEEKINLENAIATMEKVKDKEEVERIKLDYGLTEYNDKFDSLVNKVHKAFKKFHPVINTIIYNNFTDNNLPIDYNSYKSQIEGAIARGYIDREYYIQRNYNNLIEDVYNALNELRNYLSQGIDNDLIEKLEEEYKTNIILENLDFWEKVIDIKLYY